MATKLDTYFGVADFTQIIGDQLEEAFIYEVNGANKSFTDFTVSGEIVDKSGATVTTLTVAKSTTTVTDDTITVTASPSDLPSKEGIYGYWITYVSDTDANEVRTFVKGKIEFIEKFRF